MRGLFAFVVASMALRALAAGPTVGLPNGARWAVFAPRADRFVREAGAVLETAAKSDPPLSPRMLNNDFVRSTGLGLLSTEELAARGVDTTRGWTMFERQGATFLEVTVKDRQKLVAGLEAWGAGRLLKAREEKATANGKGALVTFARAKGTRAAAGYLVAGDRAVIMLRPAERTAALEQAMAAVENAPPVRAPVDGTIVAWFDAAGFARDAWLGLQASDKGVDVSGSARDVDPGWVVADAAKKWVAPLLGPSKDESVLRLRFNAGEKAARELARLFTQASGPSDQKAVDVVSDAAKGPLELFVSRLVPPAGGAGVSAQSIVNVLSPALVLPERGDRADAVRDAAKGSSGEYRVGSAGKNLLVGLGDHSPREPAPEPSGTPALSCGNAKPLASLRLDGASIDRSLEGIGLFGAMRDELLMGLYAIHSELGLLLRRLEPAVAVACQDGNRATLSGRIRFRADPR